jgi:hypothetical protein
MKKIIFLIFTVWGGVAAGATMQPTSGDRLTDSNITFPDKLLAQNGGPIINIKNPPDSSMHAAVGDGVTDDTVAFQDAYDLILKNYQASGPYMRDMYIYIPDGTYRITNTIIYRGALYKWKKWAGICKVKFVGQSRGKTILRLVDNDPAFQDKEHPCPIISFQHPDATFNNVASDNKLRNLTINSGSGNPGAVGVMFQSANQSDIHNVTITSGDGDGAYGLWFRMGSVQGYYSDITIQGFDYGIYDTVQPENSAGFEHLTVKQQNLAGIYLSGGNLQLNDVLSDQTGRGATALKIDEGGAQGVVINSTFTGGASGNPAIELTKDTGQFLFARNVITQGYGMSVMRAQATAVPDATIIEYVSSPAITLAPGQDTHSLALPIEETPPVPASDPTKDWAIVDDYPSVQAAMNSGKPVICFKDAKYKVTGDVTVPASVKFINFLGSGLNGGALIVSEDSADPLVLQDGHARVRVQANRNVAERCMAEPISNDKGLPVTFYLENVNDCTSGDNFCRTGQKVFARGIDIEYKNAQQIVCNGGALWVFNFKTEDVGTAAPFVVKNGGWLEVLGGYVNMVTNLAPPAQQAPMITNIDSNASIICSTNMTQLYAIAVRETRHGATVDAPSSNFPNRGGGYRRNFVVPLYVGSTK